MIKKKTTFNVIALIFFSVIISFSFEISAQNNLAIVKLQSTYKRIPIEGATWHYGLQRGISNSEGEIKFTYSENDELTISHVSYGQWSLSSDEVLNAIQTGRILHNELVMRVQPVTVLSLHGKQQNDEYFLMDSQDRLAHDAGALMSRTPLISTIKKSGSYGFDPVLRGFKYDQLNIVIDGVQCASAACPNRMDPPISQISPNMIEQVEIMKGPYSLRYGNSFGGTINFKKGDPTFSDANKTFGRISGNYELNGNIVRTEVMGGTRGQKYEASLFGAYSSGGNYIDGDGITVPSSFMRGSIGANLGYAINSQQFLTSTLTRNFARDADFPALPMDLRSDDTWLLNASYKIVFQDKSLKKWKTNVYATMVDHLMDNLTKKMDPRMVNAITNASTLNFGGRTEATLGLGEGILYAGADFRNELVEGMREREFLMGPMKGKKLFDNPWQKGEVIKSALFAEYLFEMNGINLSFSSRIELNNAQALEADDKFIALYNSTSTAQINPGISIGGSKQLNGGISVGLWLGRAQRSASITERYINYFPVGLDPYEILGNPELVPEVNNQVDFKIEYHSMNTAIEATFFAAYLTNYISSEIITELSPRMSTSPGVRQFSNIGEALMTGTEIAWSQKLFAGLSHHASMAFTLGQNLVEHTALPEIAPLDFRYTLTGNYLNGKLNPQVTLRHVLKQDRIALAYGETETPSFTLVDLNVNYSLTKIINLSVGAQNLFDIAYYEHLSRSVKGMTPRAIYAPGRNIYFTMILNLR